MKLFYVPGVCSLSPHIALRESGLKFELDKVDRKTKVSASGVNYMQVNPRGYVPALQLDDGTVLTEGANIVQYIADQAPAGKLAPKYGTKERYKVNEWLVYVATEIHKGGFSPLFRATDDAQKQTLRDAFAPKLDFLNNSLEGKQFLTGDSFTVADGYLFTVLTWSAGQGIDLAKWPHLKAFFDRVAARPSVVAALAAEKS